MILIVFGLPGTGKSHFSKHMAEEIEATYLNTDIIRQKMNKQGQYDEISKQLVYDQLLREMASHISVNENVILDGTFNKKLVRDRFIHKARELKQEIYFVEMKSGDQTVKNRMQSGREYSEADYQVYLKIKNSYEHMEEPHLTLWSDEQSMKEMITKTKNFIYG